MIDIKIIYDNGDYDYTKINCTFEDAKRYYVGKIFNIGRTKDKLVKCTNIELVKN